MLRDTAIPVASKKEPKNTLLKHLLGLLWFVKCTPSMIYYYVA